MAFYYLEAQPSQLFRCPHPPHPTKARVMFVHGAWEGAWVWQRWQAVFAQRGYDNYAIDLPGHGSRRWDGWTWRAGIDDYVEAVHKATGEVGECVLVGLSMGGFIIQKYLERYPAPAAVLVASVPHTGVSIKLLADCARYMPAEVLKFFLTFPMPFKNEAAIRDLFYSADIDDDTVALTIDHGGPESARAGRQMLVFMRGKPSAIQIPTLVCEADNDKLIPGSNLRALAKALPKGELLTFANTAHVVPLDTRWQANANAVCDWLDKVGAHTEELPLTPPPNWKHAREPHLVPPPKDDLALALPTVAPEVRPLIHRPENKG